MSRRSGYPCFDNRRTASASRCRGAWLLAGAAVLSAAAVLGADAPVPEARFVDRTAWSTGEPEAIVPGAARVGFNELIVWAHDRETLEELVRLGNEHGVAVFSAVGLNQIKDWKRRYPDTPPPLQRMNEAETAALRRFQSGDREGFQHGDRPLGDAAEVLPNQMLCMRDPRTAEFLRAEIRDLLAVKGLRGIAFDYIGFRNYRCCRCDRCEESFRVWRKAHPGAPQDDGGARKAFSLRTLVGFNNELAGYIRSIAPGAKIVTHVYPVFLPEPLYGNRLDVDVCGQTAAWISDPLWPKERIRQYADAIFGEEKAYCPNAEGSALVCFFGRGPGMPERTPARLAMELQTILDVGGDRVQLCSLKHLLADEAAAAVFRRFLKR